MTTTTVAWSALEAGLNALFSRLATVPGYIPSVSGSKGPSITGAMQGQIGFVAADNPVELSWQIESIGGVGRDELRKRYDASAAIAGDTYEPDPDDPDARLGGVVYSLHGQREWTLEVRIESREQTNPASGHARALVDRMRLPTASDELAALGLAYVAHDAIVDDNFDDEHGRAVSVYIMRMFFNGSSFAEDLPVTTIESSDVSTTVVG